jgi:tetratricopeptide (TPR) repeat protein
VATVYFRLGRYAESIHCWKRVLHSPPEHMKERHVLFVLARLHELNGDQKAAGECFEEVYDFVRKFNLQVSAEQYSRVKSTREYVADADTWLDHARVLMQRGYYFMVEDALRVALDKQRDQDAAHGVLDYPKENLKEIWVALARSHCFRLDADQALQALIKAQEARPYDYYVRQSLMDIDPAPEKWSDLFVMESAYALILTRLVRGFLERQRLRRERRVMGAAATKMARIFRGVRWRIRLKGMYLQLIERRSRVRTRRNWALLKMQSIGRMIKTRNEFIDYKHAALVISSGVRGMIGRTRAMRRRNEIMEAIRRRNNRAATTVQACARGFALR